MPVGCYVHKKGWHHLEQTKRKIKESNTGKKTREETKEKQRQLKFKNPVRYWLGKKRTFAGKNHWNWKGGNSRGYKTGYYSTEYLNWRKQVFERDNYTCQECFGERGQYITAHHIKSFAHYPKLRFVLNNGITLCEECHKKTDNYKGRNIRK